MPARKTNAQRTADYLANDAALLARCAKLVKPPWMPIDSVPRDGREFIGVWVDDLGTWNVEFVVWSESNNACVTHHGMVFERVLAWMPRPDLPGEPRQP